MTDRPEVTVRNDADRQRFEAVVDGEVAGHVAYVRDGDTVTMHHTEVGDAWEGKGVGSALVRKALDQVRADGGSVVPSCPFVRRYIDEHDDYAELVA